MSSRWQTWRRRLGTGAALVALVLATAGAPGRVAAESWGGIVPGESLARDVEAQFGRPTRERMIVEEGRTVPEWTYVAERAPRGIERLVVSFGLIGPQGFRPDVVRALTLYPKPHLFSVSGIGDAWGVPDAIGNEDQTGRPVFTYQRLGLLVILDRGGQWAELLLFGPRPRP